MFDRHRHIAVTAEFSTAWIEVEQNGRIGGGHSTSRLCDSLISGLAGFHGGSKVVTFDVMAGPRWVLDSPTLNGNGVGGVASAAERTLARTKKKAGRLCARPSSHF